MFVWQSADADMVRLGDLGPSSLYVQYSDYKSLGLDLGYRRYFNADMNLRFFGEAAMGVAWIDRINARFAAPRSNAWVASARNACWKLGCLTLKILKLDITAA